MRTPVAAYGGIMPQKCLLLIIVLFLIVSPVMGAGISKSIPSPDNAIYNKSYVLASDNSIPYEMYVGAIILGIVLILLSFMSGLYPNGEEGLVSIIAWIPIAFALYSSFAVDITQGFGVTSQCQGTYADYVLMEAHTVYHFDVVAVCLLILLAFAIGNTYRIWLSQKRLRQISEGEM